MMKDQRIIELIAAYGTNPDGWPAAEQAAGRMAMEAPSKAVRAAIEEYASLDALFEGVKPVEAPEHLTRAILAAAPERASGGASKPGWLTALFSSKWRGHLTATAASLVLGLGIGLGTATAQSTDANADAAIYAALGMGSLADVFDEGLE